MLGGPFDTLGFGHYRATPTDNADFVIDLAGIGTRSQDKPGLM